MSRVGPSVDGPGLLSSQPMPRLTLTTLRALPHPLHSLAQMLPSTAEELFDDLEKWFNQCISSQAARLERQNNRNPLYQ